MVLVEVIIGLAIWNGAALALFGTGIPFAERVADGRFPAVGHIWFPWNAGMCSGVFIPPCHVFVATHCSPPTRREKTGQAIKAQRISPFSAIARSVAGIAGFPQKAGI